METALENVSDPGIRIAYILAFALSPYSGTLKRINAPFDACLGETFEL